MNDRHKMYKEQMQMVAGYKGYGPSSKPMMGSYQPIPPQQQQPSHVMSSGMMTSPTLSRHPMTSHAMAAATHGLPSQQHAMASMATSQEMAAAAQPHPMSAAGLMGAYKGSPASAATQQQPPQPHSVQSMYCVEQSGSIQSGKPPQRAPSYSQDTAPQHPSSRSAPAPQGYGSAMLPPSGSIRSGAAPSGSIRTGTVGQHPPSYHRTENTVNSGLKIRPTYVQGSHPSHPVLVPHSPSPLAPSAPQPPKATPPPASPGGAPPPPQQQRRYVQQHPGSQQPQSQSHQPPSPRVVPVPQASPAAPPEGFGGSASRGKPVAQGPGQSGVVNGALDLTCLTEPGHPASSAKSGDAPLDLSVKVKKRSAEPGELERLSPASKKPRFAPPPSSPVLDLRSPEPPQVLAPPPRAAAVYAPSPQGPGSSLHRSGGGRSAYDSSPHPDGRRGSVGSTGSSPSPTVKMTPPELKHGGGVPPPSLSQQQQQPPQLIKASPGMYLGYPGSSSIAAATDRKAAASSQQQPGSSQQPHPQQGSMYPPHSPRHTSYSPLASPGAQASHVAQYKAAVGGVMHPGARGGTSPRSASSGGVVRGEREVAAVQRNGYPGYPPEQASGVIRSSQDVMGPPSSPQVAAAMKAESAAQMRMVQQQQQHQQRHPHQQDSLHHQQQQHHHLHAQQQQQQQQQQHHHHPQQYSHDVHYQRQMQQQQQHHQHQQQQQQQHHHQQQHAHQQQHQQQQQEEMQKAKSYGGALPEGSSSISQARGYPVHPHAYQHPSPTSPSLAAGYPGSKGGTMGHPQVPATSPHHLSTLSPHHLSPSSPHHHLRDPSLALAASSSQQRQAASSQAMPRSHGMPGPQTVPPTSQQHRSSGAVSAVSMQGQPTPRSAGVPGQGGQQPQHVGYSASSSRLPQHAVPMYREEAAGMASRVGGSSSSSAASSGHRPRSADQSPSAAQMYAAGMYPPPRTHHSPGANSAPGVSPQLSPQQQQSIVHGGSQGQIHSKPSPGAAAPSLSSGSGHHPLSQHPSPGAVGRSASSERGGVPSSGVSGGLSGHPSSSGNVAAYHVSPGGAPPSLHPSATGIAAFHSPANGLPSQMYQTGLAAASMAQPHVPASAQPLPPRQASSYDQQALRSPSNSRGSAGGGYRPSPASSYSHPAVSQAAAASSTLVSQERSLGHVAEMQSNLAAATSARMRSEMLEHTASLAQRSKAPQQQAQQPPDSNLSSSVLGMSSITVTSSQALSSLSAPRTTVTQALTSSVMSSTASPSSMVSAGSSVTSASGRKVVGEEVGVAGSMTAEELAKLSQPLEIAIPGASSSGITSNSSITTSSSNSGIGRSVPDLPPPTGTAPKSVVKQQQQPPPVPGASSSSSSSCQPSPSPKPMSRKHRLMTAFNKDEDLRRMQPPANPPDPSKASTSSSGGDFKAPTVSPSSPPSPKMPILSPQQAPAPHASPMHNEPPTLDPPAPSEKRLLPNVVVKDRHALYAHGPAMDKSRGQLPHKPHGSPAFRGLTKPPGPSSVMAAGPAPPPKSQVRTSVVMSVSSSMPAGLTSSAAGAESVVVVASVSETAPLINSNPLPPTAPAPMGPAPQQPPEAPRIDKGGSSESAGSAPGVGGVPMSPLDVMPVSKDDMSCNINSGGEGGGGTMFPKRSDVPVRRNSLPERHWIKNKNIPVANVAPFQHPKVSSKDGRGGMVVGPPDVECNSGSHSQDPGSLPQEDGGSPPDVKTELEEEKNEDEKDVPSPPSPPAGNQNRRQSPRKVPYMRKLVRLTSKTGTPSSTKKDRRFIAAPLKFRLLRASQEFPGLDDNPISLDKASSNNNNASSSAGRRKKQQQRRQQQQQQQQQRRRRRQQQQRQQQQQQQEEKSESGKGKRSLLDELSWPTTKKARDPGDLLADPALLGREERALRRAIIEFDKMESKGEPRDSRVTTRRATGQVSNANRKAQELKKRALGDRRRVRDLSRRPLRSCTLRQRRFADFEPTPLQRRPRRRRCQTRYNRNAAYEKELKREESRRALKRRQRERMRAGQTAHSDSDDDTTDGEREEEGEEEDEDLEKVSVSGSAEDEGSKQGESESGSGNGGQWEIKEAKRALRSDQQQRLKLKLQWRRSEERKSQFGRQLRRRVDVSPDSSDTGNAHHQQRYPAAGSRRRQGKQSRPRPESDNELLFSEESSDSDQSQVSGRLPFQDVAEDSNSVPVPPELRKLAVNKNSGETLLHKATKPGYEEVALYCLRTRSVEVNARDNAGYTPLHECCVRGNLMVAWYLILHGADVNCCSQDGIRPVHDAVENEHVEIVRLLLSCGADPSIATYAGKTPLKIARSQVMRDLIRGYLADLNGWECEAEEEQEEEEEEEVPWLFQASSDFMDPAECSGFDVFADVPSDPEDEPEELFDDDLTAAVPTYDLPVSAGSIERDRFVLVEAAARELGVREEEVMRLCGRDGPCLRREEFLQLTAHCVVRPRQPKTERVRLLRLSTLKQHAQALSALAAKSSNNSGSSSAASSSTPASGKHSPAARQGYAAAAAAGGGKAGMGPAGTNNMKIMSGARQTPATAGGRHAAAQGDQASMTPALTSSASYPPAASRSSAYGKNRVMGGGGGLLQNMTTAASMGGRAGPSSSSSSSTNGPHSQMFKPIKESSSSSSPRKQVGGTLGGGYFPHGKKSVRDDLSVSLQKLHPTEVPQPRRPQASAPSARSSWSSPSSANSLSSSSSSSPFSKTSPGSMSSMKASSLQPSLSAPSLSSSSSTVTSNRLTVPVGGKQGSGAHGGGPSSLTPGMKSHSYPHSGRSAASGPAGKLPLALLSGRPSLATSRSAMTTFGQPSVVLSNSRISGEGGRSAFVSKQGATGGRPLSLGPGSRQEAGGQDPRGGRERGSVPESQAKEDVYKFKVGTVPEDCLELATMKVLHHGGSSHAVKAPGNQP